MVVVVVMVMVVVVAVVVGAGGEQGTGNNLAVWRVWWAGGRTLGLIRALLEEHDLGLHHVRHAGSGGNLRRERGNTSDDEKPLTCA